MLRFKSPLEYLMTGPLSAKRCIAKKYNVVALPTCARFEAPKLKMVRLHWPATSIA